MNPTCERGARHAPAAPDASRRSLTIPLPRRCGALATALAAIACGPLSAPAYAAYGPGAQPASSIGSKLGDDDSAGASISDDGRYVVFTTTAIDLLGRPPKADESYTTGIVRRDMISGAVEVVAPPRRVRGSTVLSPGQGVDVTISGNGRYVLFDTTEPLTPGDENTGRDVYVRDMSRPATDRFAYELVSALDGTDTAPDYVDANRARGSQAGRIGFGISDDGRRAVFWTQARSNLPAPAATTAPPGQVLLRLLDAKRTVLVTANELDGKPVAPSGGLAPKPDPVLSGDGSSVAWVDVNPAPQTLELAGEPSVPAILWRDVNSPGGPTRRVAGTSDADDPGCPAGSAFPSGTEADTGPCFGPFAQSEALPDLSTGLVESPSISDDGRRLVFLTASHARPFDQRTAGVIAYLADMTPGLTRKQGVSRIVRALGASADIREVALAGDGRRLALTSLSSTYEGPRTVGPVQSDAVPTTNIFVVDLDLGIVQRASIGNDGTDYRGPVLDPTVGTFIDPVPVGLAVNDDASAIAFSAGDGNLFLGDANASSDVQVVQGAPGATVPSSAFSASEQPPGDAVRSARDLSLNPLAATHILVGPVVVDKRGVARVVVRVPAAGKTTATGSAAAGKRRMRVGFDSRTTRGSATVHLRISPTLSGRKAARRARRLRVRIDLRYVPRRGRATKAARSYTLTRAAAAR